MYVNNNLYFVVGNLVTEIYIFFKKKFSSTQTYIFILMGIFETQGTARNIKYSSLAVKFIEEFLLISDLSDKDNITCKMKIISFLILLKNMLPRVSKHISLFLIFQSIYSM